MPSKRESMVSIILPVRNESEFISKAIKNFLENDYPSERMEIIVVDGCSEDGTHQVVEQLSRIDGRVKLVDNPDKITPVGMNLGVKAAKGEYILIAGSHSEYAKDYLESCVEVIERTGAGCVGGYMETVPGKDTAVGRAIAAATSSGFGVGNSMFRLSGPEREVDTVPFGMYRKEIFEKIGLYDERLVRNQDIELNSRLRKAGGRIIISPEIKLKYYNRATYRGLWQQSFNNGLWNPYTIWLVGGGLSLRHFVPMFFVVGLAVLTAGAFFWWPVKWILLGYVLLYLSAAGSFAVKQALDKKASAVLILCSYVVLHAAYGLGSIWSILTIPFKFPDRHKKIVGKALADRKT